MDWEALIMLTIATALLQVVAHLLKNDHWRAPLTYCIGLGIIIAGESGYGLATGKWEPAIITALFAVTNGAAVMLFYWRDHGSSKDAYIRQLEQKNSDLLKDNTSLRAQRREAN